MTPLDCDKLCSDITPKQPLKRLKTTKNTKRYDKRLYINKNGIFKV